MSYNLGLIACNALQDDLNNNFACLPVMEALPFVEIMFSDANLSGIQQKISGGDGKYRAAQLLYTPRHPESSVSTTVGFDCSTTKESSVLSHTYEIDITAGVKDDEHFAITTMAAMCKSNSMWIAERIQAKFDVLLRRMDTLFASQMAGLVGAFPSGDNDLTGTTLKSVETLYSDGKVSPDFVQEIGYTALLAEFCANPIVIGGGKITKAMRLLQAGCCANYGVDLGAFLAQNIFAYFHSNRVETALGTDEFLVYEIGKVQPIWYNRFAGENSVVDNSYYQTVIVEPRYGIPFDVTMKVDCGVIHMEFGLATKLVGLPSDVYDFGDRLYQTNGVYNFKVVNP